MTLGRVLPLLVMTLLSQGAKKLSCSFSLEAMAAGGRRSQTRKRRGASPTKVKPKQTTTKPQVAKQTSKTPSTIGEAIQYAGTTENLLQVASTLWIPTDENLAPHLRTQQIHHEKRQRWSSQLLYKLGTVYGSDDNTVDWQRDDRLVRAVLAAAVPFARDENDNARNGGRNLLQALWGLYALAGKSGVTTSTSVHVDICRGISIMIERVESIARDVSLQEALEIRWASRGLLARIAPLQEMLDKSNLSHRDIQSLMTQALPNLDDRVSLLPFDIIPLGVKWELEEETIDTTAMLRDAIPFHFDTIVTRSGSSVTERRGTAWVTEEGIGALAFSGKLMPPHPLPSVVRDAMRRVETNVLGCSEAFFDCALCNHYPDGEAACKFHTDPEHGTLWERLTCVVATGSERRFAFRPIPGNCKWSNWDTVEGKNTEETMPAVVHLFPGDVVKMYDSCNDDFHHAVFTAEGDGNAAGSSKERVSLVLKRAIRRGGRKRAGHGIQGEGRRSRRKSRI